MTGQCYIDGIDIFTTYGVTIVDGSYDDLFKMPGMVEPDKNDWAEEHGTEVDLSDPKLQPREMMMIFVGGDWLGFIGLLALAGRRVVNIPYLGRSWTLRYDSMTDLGIYDTGNLFAVKFIEDTYVMPTLTTPTGVAPIVSTVSIDGITLDKFGIVVADGLDDIMIAPPLKRALTRTNTLTSGQTYDPNNPVFAEKEITVRCTMLTNSIASCWSQLDSLFATLVRPGERVIAHGAHALNGYYRRMDNVQLLAHIGKVALRFDLKINCTSGA